MYLRPEPQWQGWLRPGRALVGAVIERSVLRTRQTADALCRPTGAQAIVEDGLKEVDYKATLRVSACALPGLDVRLLRERIGHPVAAVTLFVVTIRTARLTILGDRSHLSEELKNQEGT